MIRCYDDLAALQLKGDLRRGFSLGEGAYASGELSVASGRGSFACGRRAIAIADGSVALGDHAEAIEIGQVALAPRSLVATASIVGDLTFYDEDSLFLSCEVEVCRSQVLDRDPLGIHLRCWCGWTFQRPIMALAEHPLFAEVMVEQILYHELPSQGRQLNNVFPTVFDPLEQLLLAYKICGRRLPMVRTSENAARLLVWCDRQLATAPEQHHWWLEAWSTEANKLLSQGAAMSAS